MTSSRFLTFFFAAGATLQLIAQPIIRDELQAQGQNVRAGILYDVDGDVEGDDYNGFTLAYASKVYPLDQMVISYSHMNPNQSTMRQVLLAVEEYWPVTESISPYGSVGGGYIWIDYDGANAGDTQGWFGKLGLGLLFKTGTRFDVYAELAYQVSDEDLWLDGTVAAKSNNTQAIVGVRMNY
jgi:hypothetical protein